MKGSTVALRPIERIAGHDLFNLAFEGVLEATTCCCHALQFVVL